MCLRPHILNEKTENLEKPIKICVKDKLEVSHINEVQGSTASSSSVRNKNELPLYLSFLPKSSVVEFGRKTLTKSANLKNYGLDLLDISPYSSVVSPGKVEHCRFVPAPGIQWTISKVK